MVRKSRKRKRKRILSYLLVIISQALNFFSKTIWMQSLWRRANARNVSFFTLYDGWFTFPTQFLTLNYLLSLQYIHKNLSIWIKAYKCCIAFWSCKTMAKTSHCTFESQIIKNSLLSLTDSLPVLVAFFADTPRWPRHTTFEKIKFCAKNHMLYYHSTYAIYFLCCINLLLVTKDTKIRNY